MNMFVLICIIPLCFLKKKDGQLVLKPLRHMTKIKYIVIFVVAITQFIYVSSEVKTEKHGTKNFQRIDDTFMRATPALMFTISAPINMFSVYREIRLDKRQATKLRWGLPAANVLCCICYVTFATVMYYRYGERLQVNVLYTTKISKLRPVYRRWYSFWLNGVVICVLLLYPRINYTLMEVLHKFIFGQKT
eukprot:UN32489